MTTTVVLAEDDAVYRAGLVALLSARADLEVVGEAADGEEVLVLARRHRPDVVLMDLRMPRLDGVGATAVLTADPPDGRADRLTRVLVLTTFGDDDALYSSLRAGASGFLLKHSAPQYLVVAVREVACGNSWLDPAVAGRVIAGLAAPRDVPADVVRLVQRLTPREVQVLRLMASGLTNADITDALTLSEATVKTHVSRILLKTGAGSRTQAVVLAYRAGLADPG